MRDFSNRYCKELKYLKNMFQEARNITNKSTWETNPPAIVNFGVKWISINFPKRLLLLLRVVFAFPNASSKGLAAYRSTLKLKEQKSRAFIIWQIYLQEFFAQLGLLKLLLIHRGIGERIWSIQFSLHKNWNKCYIYFFFQERLKTLPAPDSPLTTDIKRITLL